MLSPPYPGGRSLLLLGGMLCVLFASCRGAGAQARDSGQSKATELASRRAPQLSAEAAWQDEDMLRRSPLVRWCSSGGAPIVGHPVLDPKERTYVATSDGYLHAFERDGRYRWSYTVKGTPLGSVSLRSSDGVILLGTTSRYVYAINQSGHLHWSFRTVSPVWSGLFALNSMSVVFLGLDRRLYALSNTGAALYRVRAPSVPTIDPVVASHDVVWVGMDNGVARFVAAFRLERYALPSAAEQVVALGDDALARAGGRAFYMEPGQEPQELGEADYLAAHEDAWLRATGKRLLLYRKNQHRRILHLPPSTELSSAPALSSERLWAPLSDGSLAVLDLATEGATWRQIAVSEAPLRTPVVGYSGRRVMVPAASGEFCMVELE